MNKIETVILDFDGTIADTKNSIIQTIQATLEILGLPKANDNEIKNLIGLPLEETFIKAAQIKERGILEEAIRIYRENYNSISLDTIQLFPQVASTLQNIFQRGITITVASSKGRDALLLLLNKLNISQYISYTLGEQDVVNKKPAPDMVLMILEQTQSTPQQTLVIGDTVYDIAMGQGANCITCGVTYGYNTKEQLVKQGANHIVDCFGDVLGMCI